MPIIISPGQLHKGVFGILETCKYSFNAMEMHITNFYCSSSQMLVCVVAMYKVTPECIRICKCNSNIVIGDGCDNDG